MRGGLNTYCIVGKYIAPLTQVPGTGMEIRDKSEEGLGSSAPRSRESSVKTRSVHSEKLSVAD